MAQDWWSAAALPRLGVGLGYRTRLAAEIANHKDRLDWLEVVAENFLPLTDVRLKQLRGLAELNTCIPHGVDLSLTGEADIDRVKIAQCRDLVDALEAPWYSDHLASSTSNGRKVEHFITPRRDHETAHRTADRIAWIQDLLQVPFLIENVASVVDAGGPLSPGEFTNEICTHANCGLLLDLANAWADEVNFGLNASTYLDELDLSRVVQVHIAGGRVTDGWLADTHDGPVEEPVWRLLAELARRHVPPAVLLERDANFPDDFGELLAEVDRARVMVYMESLRDGGSAYAGTATPNVQAAVRPSAGAAASRSHENQVQRAAESARRKRWEHVVAWFPLTTRALTAAADAPEREELLSALEHTEPRLTAEEDAIGLREAELQRFRRFFLAQTRTSPALETAVRVEAAIVDLQLQFERAESEHDPGEPSASCLRCQAAGKMTTECSAVHLEIPPQTRLLDLPDDFALVEAAISSNPSVPELLGAPSTVAVHKDGADDPVLYRLNSWQAWLLSAAASRASCTDTHQRWLNSEHRAVDFDSRLEALRARSLVRLTHSRPDWGP